VRPFERRSSAIKPYADLTPHGTWKIKEWTRTAARLFGAGARTITPSQCRSGPWQPDRTMSGDQEVVFNRVDTPVLDLGIDGAQAK